jgi:effector-binding domain-containing protein
LCEIALERLPAVGVAIGEGLVGIFPLDLPDTMTVAVGVPLPKNAHLPDGLAELELPGGGWASTLHVGPYDALALAYTALFERIAELGHETVGPVEEIYLSTLDTPPPDEPVTRLAVPLAEP